MISTIFDVNGAWRVHRIWTSYYCSKFVVIPPFTSRNGHFPPQTPENQHFRYFSRIPLKSWFPWKLTLKLCFAWTTHESLPYKAYFHGIFTFGLPFSPNSTHFMPFSWKSPKMVVFRGLERKMTISGGKGCEYYQFGAVIVCPNAMAAPGTILHPETPTNQHFSYSNGILMMSTKMMVLEVVRE